MNTQERAATPKRKQLQEYLRRNLLHAKAVGAVASAEAAKRRLQAQKRPPKWLLASLDAIIDRGVPVHREMAAHRNEVHQ